MEEEEYLQKLTEKEQKALKISQDMLGIKKLSDTNGFKEFLKKKSYINGDRHCSKTAPTSELQHHVPS